MGHGKEYILLPLFCKSGEKFGLEVIMYDLACRTTCDVINLKVIRLILGEQMVELGLI